ncbi:MAG: sulfatase-like hydrolase/transferase [Bacteroidia bacterium]
MNSARSTIYRLLAQLSSVLVAYFVCRVVFLISNSSAFNFSSITSILLLFVGALRFDVAAILITNSLFILLTLLGTPLVHNSYYQRVLKWIFIVVNSVCIVLNMADVGYFPFVHKRMQFDAFLFLNGDKGTDFYRLLPSFLMEHWYLILLYIAIVYGMIKAYNKTLVLISIVPQSIKNYAVYVLTFLVTVGVSIIGVRGGLQLRPLSIIQASEMTEVQYIPAIINTPFSIINTISQQRLAAVNYYTNAQLTPCFTATHTPQPTAAFTKQNVVVIIVESLSKNYLSFFNGQAQTPFLDSLLGKSRVYSNAFANGSESIQGIPAVLSSIPSWQEEPFIFSPYNGNKITSLANLLKPQGYSTSFFHGGSNGTMGFDSYCKLAEFDNYYGRTEYNNEADYDGNWGIWDEPFLQYVANTLTTTPQPFMSAVFTLNTHHPFTVPAKYKARFKQNGHDMLSCVAYADYALAQFFETAKKQPWFNNTLFVLTADHAGPKLGDTHNAVLDYYRIPIAFYSPTKNLAGIDTTVANQIDIMPSVMYLLNYKAPYFSLGKNLFDTTCPHFAVTYREGIYQYIDANYCYQFNGQTGTGYYNYNRDSLFAHNMYATSIDNTAKANEYLKKTIQVFNNTMINNTMKLSTPK